MVRILFSLILLGQLAAAEVALVTGAVRGIGYATAELLAENGYTVYAGVRSTSSLEQLQKAEAKYPGRIHRIELDVTDAESVEKAVGEIVNREGRIDILVNNAGINLFGSVENVTVVEAKRIFDINFFGVMRVTQGVLPIMRAQKSGRIIQISSRSGFRPYPTVSVYAASKFAVEGLSETMASTLKPWNITVSLIEPGPVLTDMINDAKYGSRLKPEEDPYLPIFIRANLLPSPKNSQSKPRMNAQDPREIAQFVLRAVQDEKPLFRYQTTKAIEEQAVKYLNDPTGLQKIEEWHEILFR